MSHRSISHAQSFLDSDSQVRERYLAFFEKQLERIHEGHKAETGLIQKGILERKQTCEDVKLKQSKMGLFVVADGDDWFTPREAVKAMYEHLGETLDEQVKHVCDHSDPTETLRQLTQFVASVLKTAVTVADQRIHVALLHSVFETSGTTLSCGKLISITDTIGDALHRFFFLNVGDTRIYLQRQNGSFQKLTVDDTYLQQWVHEGKLTPEDFSRIDQAISPKHLRRTLFPYATHINRFRLTRCLGRGEVSRDLPTVSFVDVQPGERIVMTTDGITNQLLESEIQTHLFHEKNDNAAEFFLQQTALARSLDAKQPRSLADDICVLVHTV